MLRYAVFLTNPLPFLGIDQSLCSMITEQGEFSTLHHVANAKNGLSMGDPNPQIRVSMLFDIDGFLPAALPFLFT